MQSLLNHKIMTILVLLFCASTAFGQQAEDEIKPEKRSNQRLMIRLSEQDVILPISSIEWGYPDRWSFTSRYIHSLHEQRKGRTWHHNIDVCLSPGLSGGRLGAGYLGLYNPPSMRDFGFFYQLNGVLLRTWGDPLVTETNTTFLGAELKIGISWLLNFGAGYYSPINNSSKDIKPFWGLHLGVGI